MMSPRARFGAAALQDRLYAIGGSDGARDLDSVHFLEFESGKWKEAAPLKTARSSVGECAVQHFWAVEFVVTSLDIMYGFDFMHCCIHIVV